MKNDPSGRSTQRRAAGLMHQGTGRAARLMRTGRSSAVLCRSGHRKAQCHSLYIPLRQHEKTHSGQESCRISAAEADIHYISRS